MGMWMNLSRSNEGPKVDKVTEANNYEGVKDFAKLKKETQDNLKDVMENNDWIEEWKENPELTSEDFENLKFLAEANRLSEETGKEMFKRKREEIVSGFESEVEKALEKAEESEEDSKESIESAA